MQNFPDSMDSLELAEEAKNICFIYSRFPFPMMRGDQLTVAHYIEYLSSRGHNVDFYCLDCDGEPDESNLKWLMDRCRVLVVTKHGFFQKIWGLFFGLFRLLPMQVGLFTNYSQIKEVAKGRKEKKYDVTISYYIRSAEVAKKSGVKREMKILAMQLSQHLNTKRIYENIDNPFKKIIYFIETLLVKRYESRVWSGFDRVGLIGEKDVAQVDEDSGGLFRDSGKLFYSPHGTSIKKFKMCSVKDEVPGRIVFSGSMLYEPNVQAITWFVEKCWSRVKKVVPNASLYIVGRDPVQSVKDLSLYDEDIVVTGTVPDVWQYINHAQVCINPMQAAGGMQNKLIEYLASGKAVVATSVANEGVLAGEGVIKIADSAENFSEMVVDILLNPGKYESMKVGAREFVEQSWTWEAHFLKQEKEVCNG